MKKTLYLLFVLLFVPLILVGCGHTCDFGEWVTQIAPTYFSKGQEVRHCKNCENYETRDIPALEYSYVLTTMINDIPTYFYIQESGEYNLETPTVEGYNFLGWVDKDGNPFASTGVLTQSMTVYANLEIVETTTFEQLKIRIESGAKEIYINADIEITDCVYVYRSVTIYAEKDCTLTRNADFLGDIFVIGQNANGNNPLLENRKVTLSVKTKNNATITFDGNKSNTTKAVKGTAFYITNSSILEIYDNVIVQNFKKTANERVVAEYGNLWSSANLAGGAAVMVNYGTFNMYGGTLTDNEINLLDDEPNPNLAEGSYDSSYGGAVYNRSAFNMYGGTIKNSKAGRGGAVYNYRAFTLEKGDLLNNYSASYGGAVFMPNSQHSMLKIGQKTEENMVNISNNSSALSGGALFAQTTTNFMIFGATTFNANKNESGNGGAICTSGPLLAEDITFTNNEAVGKGGAVYLYYRDKENSVRISDLKNCTFTNNKAEYGAGLSLFASSTSLNQGAIATVSNCEFMGNSVTANGGAVYVGRDSKITIKNSKFESNISNSAEYGGGAIYFTTSTGVLENIEFKKNSSTFNAGAIGIYSSSVVNAKNISLIENTATKSGGAIYISKSTFNSTENITFTGNSATTGGAINVYSSSTANISGVTASSNSSSANGGFMYVSNSTASLTKVEGKESLVSLNSSSANGGAIAVHSAGTLNLYGIKFNQNEATDLGGALYVKGATANVGSTTYTEENIFDANEAKNGGAIYVETSKENNGIFNAYKLTLTNNIAKTNAGGLFVTSENDTIVKATIEYLTVTGNSSSNNGGAFYAYTNSALLIKNLTATENKSANYGGVAYISGAADVEIQNVNASNNESNKGGFIYITTTGSELRILAGSILNNVATEGSMLFSNSSGATIRFKGGAETTEIEYDKTGIAGKNEVTILDIEGEE